MKLVRIATTILLAGVLASCGLKSEGTKLTSIVEGGDAEVGKEHAVTLEHKNVFYTSNDRMYAWAEDDDGTNASIYFSQELKPKIYNLEPGSEYIYKFTVTEGGKYPKMQLIDVADLEGSIISDSIGAPDTAMRVPFLDGKEGAGKEYTVKAKFSSLTEKDDGTKLAYFRDPDGYQFSLVGTYPEEMHEEMQKLERKVYLVKIKRSDKVTGGLQADILEVKPAE
ncbi:MAG: hypothetical protein KDK23_08840, partial [Leptospiraceae bacterium]|nr:hypothetical protein [Leptospiraceae bacterium]